MNHPRGDTADQADPNAPATFARTIWGSAHKRASRNMRYRHPYTYVLAYAYAKALLGRQALWPYGAIFAPSRNSIEYLSSADNWLGHRLTMP